MWENLSKGIAVAGIWIGVGIASFSAGEAIIGVASIAAVATIFGLIVWD